MRCARDGRRSSIPWHHRDADGRDASSVYSATKFAVRAFARECARVTIVSPGFVRTGFLDAVPDLKADLAVARDKIAIPPDAIARAIAFAIEEPSNVDKRDRRTADSAGVK